MQFTLRDCINDILPAANKLMLDWVEKQADDDDLTWQNRVFKVEATDSVLHEFRSRPRIERWSRWTENEPTRLVKPREEERVQVETVWFKQGFIATDLYMKYANGKRLETSSLILNDWAEFIPEFVEAGMRGMPEMAAGVLLNAFSSSAQALPDGTALVAASHTDVPVNNLATTKLSLQLLREIEAKRYYVDEHGEPRRFRYDTIIYGPDKAAEIEEIFGTLAVPYTDENTTNVWRSRYKNFIECPWLIDEVESGASEYIFFADSRRHNLKGRIVELPHLQQPFQTDTETYKSEGRTGYLYFPLNNAGFAGSNGTTNPDS